MNEKPLVSNTFIKFQSTTNKKDVVFVSLTDLIDSGIPIDFEGEEMVQMDDFLYTDDGDGDYVVVE